MKSADSLFAFLFHKLAPRNGLGVFEGFGRTVDTQDYNTASADDMSLNSYGSGGTRNIDMAKTEADLAINIRKATSIGECQL